MRARQLNLRQSVLTTEHTEITEREEMRESRLTGDQNTRSPYSLSVNSVITVLLVVLLFSSGTIHAERPPSSNKIRALYSSLDTRSLSQLLAFHQLYPDTAQGEQALSRAAELLGTDASALEQALPTSEALSRVVGLLSGSSQDDAPLDPAVVALINKAGDTLSNRSLKGHTATTEAQVLALPPEEIDVARALLLSQYGAGHTESIEAYEAVIDLMALQIRAYLPTNAEARHKIDAINRFIFDEMWFRFPPNSVYAQDIDLYTFLPSVIDSRRGVCLGVSMLYLCLSQRLDLPLEIVTPPGHIYLRYRDDFETINIETTARGIDLPSEVYLGIDTRSLQLRDQKESIGLTYINQASVYWQREEYDKALSCYEKAAPYLPDDMLLKELFGYNLLFTGKTADGTKYLQQVRSHTPDYAVSAHTMADDYLAGRVNAEGLQAIFMHTDETTESVVAKRERIQAVLQEYPHFRAGWFHLAVTWLQQQRGREALGALTRAWQEGEHTATTAYYLAALRMQRYDFIAAWGAFSEAETLVTSRDHDPKALKGLKQQMLSMCPRP